MVAGVNPTSPPDYRRMTCAAGGTSAVAERVGDELHDVRRHPAVDLIGERDEARLVALEAQPPREVVRIGRQTMPTQPRPRVERHEAERLRGGGADHLPHRDAEAAAHDRELVHQGDVDRAERVLEELDHLSRLRPGHRNDLTCDARVERRRELAARGRETADYL